MPDEFAAHVRTWLSVCRSLTSRRRADARSSSCFIFQTLLGVWPISEERLAAYLEKAMREAKQHTTWVEPDEAHEAAVQAFARALLTPPRLPARRSSPSSARSPRRATAPRSASCCSS